MLPTAPSLARACANIEPDEALFAGEEGSTPIARSRRNCPRLLNQGGLAAVEIGHDQADAVTALLARDGLRHVSRTTLADAPARVLLTWV